MTRPAVVEASILTLVASVLAPGGSVMEPNGMRSPLDRCSGSGAPSRRCGSAWSFMPEICTYVKGERVREHGFAGQGCL